MALVVFDSFYLSFVIVACLDQGQSL